MISFISFSFLIISVLGLLGMAAFNVETKIKEIGMRKVLGDSPWNIFYLLSIDFMNLILLSGIIGPPLGYFIGASFLNAFSFKITIGIGTFLSTITVIGVLGFLTLASQTLKSAFSSPIKFLR